MWFFFCLKLALFAFVKKKFGSIDIVVNNAGINGEVYPQCEKVVDVNVVRYFCASSL